jgi:hypothetical protein
LTRYRWHLKNQYQLGHLHIGVQNVPIWLVPVAAHHRLNRRQACLWEILLLQSRVRTTRTSSRNDVLNKGKAGEACWRPLKLPTRAVHHRHPSVLAGESTQTYPGALSRSTAQPKNVEANVGAASRQRCAQLSDIIGHACKRARRSLGARLGATTSAGTWP